jgi:hypothetical protein
VCQLGLEQSVDGEQAELGLRLPTDQIQARHLDGGLEYFLFLSLLSSSGRGDNN